MKPCRKCGATNRYSSGHSSAGKCAPCARERSKQWAKDNPEKARRNTRKWDQVNGPKKRNWYRKDWAPGEHEKAESERPLVTACACCGSKEARHPKGWLADHDHSSGRFRGHLCHPCNIRLGLAEKYGLELSVAETRYLRLNLPA